MKLLKNKDTLRLFAVLLGLGAAACVPCFVFDTRCGFICLGLTAAVIAVCAVSAGLRFGRMERLSNSIDRMIDGAQGIDLAEYAEGELGILQNQLEKLTVRLKSQTSELKKDKQLLADSIADISHQIRTPLTAINLIIAALNEPSVRGEKQTELLSQLNRQLAKIDWLVSSLLKLAKLDARSVSMSPERVELKRLVEEALAPVSIQMDIKEQTAAVSASGFAECDISWTAEALTNIIKNCSEHMGAGTLFIDASENPLYSEIVIRDSGPGIDTADLPHIFERFYKGKNSSDTSVGIGLALCRGIISEQNGTVKAENDIKGGAKFTIRLYKNSV